MSKFILYEWRCEDCGTKFSDLAKPEVQSVTHEGCGGTAPRVLSSGHIDPRLGVDPDGFPTMADKWARTHRQRAKVEEKKARDHGPNAFGSSGADVSR